MKKFRILLLIAIFLSVGVTGCNSQNETEINDDNVTIQGEDREMKINVIVNDITFTAFLEQNEAVDALLDMMNEGPVTINMQDYAGFEKVGSLPTSLPTQDQRITTQPGDIVLYQGNQIVMFYGTNSWSYTRLGHIDDLSGWQEALGNENVTTVFSL